MKRKKTVGKKDVGWRKRYRACLKARRMERAQYAIDISQLTAERDDYRNKWTQVRAIRVITPIPPDRLRALQDQVEFLTRKLMEKTQQAPYVEELSPDDEPDPDEG